ncbi:MAG: pyruvate formate-lyase-activating protein [Bacillota bacterium]|nr:pyruvate formate-lyase-activating protein [Bacillota bacterium]
MTTAKLHSIETFGAVDGPGIRTIFFLQGCPARCLYCHNPDTWAVDGGKTLTLVEMLHTAMRSIPYYGKDGGVTFSGGEPLMQGEFVLEAIRLLRKNGIGTVIDTSATHMDEYTEDIVRECQMLLLDVKHSDPKEFSRISGCSQKKLLEVIDMANRHDTPAWVRQVIVPGINDTEENVKFLAKFVKERIHNPYKVELLGYHTMALDKYEKLGMKYRLDGVKPMEKRKLNQLSRQLNRLLEE